MANQIVTIGKTVTFTIDDATYTFKLVDGNAEEGEISTNSLVGRKILNSKVDAIIRYKDNSETERTIEIVSIT